MVMDRSTCDPKDVPQTTSDNMRTETMADDNLHQIKLTNGNAIPSTSSNCRRFAIIFPWLKQTPFGRPEGKHQVRYELTLAIERQNT
jgi:hypothetical protein